MNVQGWVLHIIEGGEHFHQYALRKLQDMLIWVLCGRKLKVDACLVGHFDMGAKNPAHLKLGDMVHKATNGGAKQAQVGGGIVNSPRVETVPRKEEFLFVVIDRNV